MPFRLGSRGFSSVETSEFVDLNECDGFDLDTVARYLAGSKFDCGELSIRRFARARSNPTFLIRSGYGTTNARSFVLRKAPLGADPMRFVQIEREYRIMSALADRLSVPVPKPHIYCGDDSILGTPFYIQNYVQGRMLGEAGLEEVAPAERRGVYHRMIDSLSALHDLDTAGLGLGPPVATNGFMQRQLVYWQRQYQQVAARADPALIALGHWLAKHMPTDVRPRLVHGQFRLSNLLFDSEDYHLTAVLDWEKAALGHPLADLAYACLPYYLPRDTPALSGIAEVDLVKQGLPDEAELLDRYRRSRRLISIDHWTLFIAYALFDIAVQTKICADADARSLEIRQPRGIDDQVAELAEIGWQMVRYHQSVA